MGQIEILIEQVNRLTFLLDKALLENTALKVELNFLKNKKNSSNSSVPPSKDENRPAKNQTLREVTGKKVGGQIGHKGSTLEFSIATHHIKETLNFCRNCGKSLENIDEVLLEKRQVIEIPPIAPIVNEYQRISKTCTCGKCNESKFPSKITAPIQYGSSIEAMVAYLSVRQYMPFARIKEYLNSVFGLNMSQGTIQNILARVSNSLTPAYNQIKATIEKSQYAGGDETSVKINGIKNWFWTLQNELNTFIICTNNRAFETLEKLFPNGLQHTIIGHDCYSAWFKFKAFKHQACLAHLQREIKFFIETYTSCQWIKDLKQLFYNAIEWSKSRKTEDNTFNEQLQKLLNEPPDANFSLLIPFVKRLTKYKNAIFTFLDHSFVPPDNNGSERAIRNVKVKQKVSCQFKSIDNANIFAVIRSVFDTLSKNNLNILENLELIINIKVPE